MRSFATVIWSVLTLAGGQDIGTKRSTAFYRDVTENRFQIGTPQRSVDGVLARILGREAALRNDRLNMEQSAGHLLALQKQETQNTQLRNSSRFLSTLPWLSDKKSTEA